MCTRDETSLHDRATSLRPSHLLDGNRGFTLVELVLVLVILAVLASAALNMVDIQVDQTRFESTQNTLGQIERAVLGADYARAADGSLVLSGFVADCGRLPYSLEELYVRPPSLIPTFASGSPIGDQQVTLAGGWNGPYLQLPIGGATLRDGWAASFELFTSVGVLSGANEPVSILRSLGRDQTVGGVDYDADLSLIFKADDIYPNLSTQVENRVEKSCTVYVYYNDSSTNPDPSNGKMIVVRVYGPVVDESTGEVSLGTVDQQIFKADSTYYSVEEPVSVSLSNLAIGPRILRVYQLDTNTDPITTDELSTDANLQAVSVPIRLVVSRETSSMQVILRDN